MLKKLTGIFFLLAFLIPIGINALHCHPDDEKCNTVTEYHLHKKEHNCKVCDQHFTAESVKSDREYSFFRLPIILSFSEKENNLPFHFTDFFRLRGPPSLS